MWERYRRQRGQQHDHGDRHDVPECDRHDGPKDRRHRAFLESQRDGEEPSHPGVEAVIATEKEQREPNVAVAHR